MKIPAKEILALALGLTTISACADTIINGVAISDGSYQIRSDYFLNNGTLNTGFDFTNGFFSPVAYAGDSSIVTLNANGIYYVQNEPWLSPEVFLNENFSLSGGNAPRLQMQAGVTIFQQSAPSLLSCLGQPACSIQYNFLPVAGLPGFVAEHPEITSVPVQIEISGEVAFNTDPISASTGYAQGQVILPTGFSPQSYIYTVNSVQGSQVKTNFTIVQTAYVPLNTASSIQINGNAMINGNTSLFGFADANAQVIIDPTIAVNTNWAYHKYFNVIQSQNLFPAPKLSATFQGSSIVLSWSAGIYGYSLQSSTDIGPLAAWNAVTNNVPVIVDGQNIVTNAAPAAPPQFYRLVKQP